METRTSGSERGAEETMVRNHHTGASASTLRSRDPYPAMSVTVSDAGQTSDHGVSGSRKFPKGVPGVPSPAPRDT
jgi:hypothetical protein